MGVGPGGDFQRIMLLVDLHRYDCGRIMLQGMGSNCGQGRLLALIDILQDTCRTRLSRRIRRGIRRNVIEDKDRGMGTGGLHAGCDPPDLVT